MKKIVIFFLCLIITIPSFAGNNEKSGYFKFGAGGWSTYYLPLNLDALNNDLTSLIGIQSGFKGEMFMHGFGGWGYVGHNIRLGGIGAMGQNVISRKPGEITKEITLNIELGGFTIEKAFHPFNKMEISIGAMLGGGTSNLKLRQWGNSTNWEELVGNGFASNSLDSSITYFNFQDELKNDFFAIMPTIGFKHNIFRWCAIGCNASYLFTTMDKNKWQMYDKNVYNMPKFDYSNVMYSINLYFGG